MSTPFVIVIAGSNGSGKSTASDNVLPRGMLYLNADEMAKSMPGYPSQAADIEASRLLLTRMSELEANRADFAMETTLASRSLAPRLVRLRRLGYTFHLMFAFLPSPEMAIVRVARRVSLGGHNIPEETIRRRYWAGIRNFFELYRPLADRWFVYDTTSPAPYDHIAEGQTDQSISIHVPYAWNLLQERAKHD